MSTQSPAAAPVDPAATSRTVSLRLIPVIFIAYVIAYVDRVNLGFAQLTMGQELGIKAAAYGVAASIFFISYFVFEVPSNILLGKFGARVWITRIMVTWGLVTIATGFVHDITWLFICRFLLGIAEAGFFPGMIYFLTQWYRNAERGKALGWLIFAQPIAFVIGALLGGFILDHVHWFGMSSWRWVFILTGVPASLWGIVILFTLPDSPLKAKWLRPEQQRWLIDTIDAEQGVAHEGLKEQLRALANPAVLLLSAVYLAFATGSYGFNLFLPLILRQINPSYSSTNIGLTAALPYVFAAIGILIIAVVFDRTRRKRAWTIGPILVAAASLAAAVLLRDQPGWALVAICLTATATFSSITPFWAVSTLAISRTQAAVGVAVINSVGNLGGVIGPSLVGWGSLGGNVTNGLWVPILGFVISAILLLFVKVKASPGAETEAIAAEGAIDA